MISRIKRRGEKEVQAATGSRTASGDLVLAVGTARELDVFQRAAGAPATKT